MQSLPQLVQIWLRASERYTKTDMVYLVGQSGWLLLGQGIIFTLSFLLAWLFANFLAPEIYGTYKFAITVATLASITTLTGMGMSVARTYAGKEAVHLPGIMRVKLTAGLIGAVATATFAGYYLLQGDTTLALLFAIVALWVPFFESLGEYQFVLQGREAFKQQAIYRIVQRLVVTLATGSSIVLSGDLLVVTGVYLASMAFTHGWFWRRVVHTYSAPSRTKEDREVEVYGFRLSLINAWHVGAAQIDKVLLYHFLGPVQLAIYFFAVALPNELNGVLGNLNSVIFPRLVGKGSDTFKRALLQKLALYMMFLTLPVAAYILVSPWLFAVFFPVYAEAVPLTQLFAGTLLLSPVVILTNYFIASKQERVLTILTVTGPTVLVIGLVSLIPLFGIVGAVFAMYARLGVEWVLNLWFFLRTTPSA